MDLVYSVIAGPAGVRGSLLDVGQGVGRTGAAREAADSPRGGAAVREAADSLRERGPRCPGRTKSAGQASRSSPRTPRPRCRAGVGADDSSDAGNQDFPCKLGKRLLNEVGKIPGLFGVWQNGRRSICPDRQRLPGRGGPSGLSAPGGIFWFRGIFPGG